MNTQNFKPIPEFENYGISKDGIIINFKRNKELKYFIDKDGYYRVGFCINNKKYNRFVHRLVALTYIDNPENFPLVDHIDGNRTNNSVENLRWVDYKGNSRNTIQNKKVIVKLETENKIFNTVSEAAEYLNISSTALVHILKFNKRNIEVSYY